MLRSRKALSPVVASIILIVVTVAVSIAVAAWMGLIDYGLLLRAIFIMSFIVLAHEIGHYVMARRFGWKPRFGFAWWHHTPSFAVYTQEVSLAIETPKDFLKAYAQLTAFGSMGILGSILAILGLKIAGLLSSDFALLFTLIFTMYGISEVSDPSVEITEVP